MRAVYAVTLGLLGLAGLLTLARAVRGPSELDRVVALEVLVILIAAGVAVDIAMRDEGWNLALLGSIALLGFLGSVAAARLVELRGARRGAPRPGAPR
ncbi:sodium:proton antiporter [Frankia sp. CNm7]|uniref:Sodium:proton antiporter n=2 Tax=Frankia nepalensis TaxID=1836974 RepID=A0A937REV4_9ACTN|nr:monovalent cation/H+ antiporter complex subunit F [Frankia nepalensis]MBL7498348.1 sodium:proton antiporter [Frankia nepalensis]MBL7514996.1 sodium:proton antiporter [Frankia nepalensis]MBL7518675.1 sodium:proton antiporter [Frankia nepalensis]MBL7628927.1 sodium:proton antiporter [Frankia nepalensis]